MTTFHDSKLERPVERKSAAEPALSSRPRSLDDHLTDATSSSGPSSLAQESLSSASSFQSLASTLSSKSSSGICVDSAPGSPDKQAADSSYVNVDIPDLDDIISACANINLNSAPDTSNFDDKGLSDTSADLSQDQTFASAADDSIDNETIIIEETLQTFKTCPNLEGTQVSTVESTTTVFKVPLPPPADQPISSPTSVIPYLSFEDSVLRKHQGTEPEFKTALTAFELPITPSRRRSYSPTPCTEIDVNEVLKSRTRSETTNESSFISANSGEASSPLTDAYEQQEEHNATEVVSVNDTIEIQAHDSTVILNSETDLVKSLDDSIIKTLEKLNVTVSKDQEDIVESKDTVSSSCSNKLNDTIEIKTSNNIEDIVQKEIATPSSQEIIVKESVVTSTDQVISQEEKVLNETQLIVQEEKALNETQVIAQVEKALNETQVIAQEEKALNETQVIGQEEKTLNKTQDIVQEEKALNETQIVVQEEKALNETQVIVQEEKALNKTQDIVQEEKALNEIQIIVQEEKPLNETQVIVQEEKASNKTQDIVQEEKALSETQTIVQEEKALNKTQITAQEEKALIEAQVIAQEEITLNKTQDIVQEEKALNKTQDIVHEKVSNKPQVVEEKILNEIPVTVQETDNLNKTQNIVQQENVLNKTEVILQENNTSNKIILEEKNNLNKSDFVLQEKNNLNKFEVIPEELKSPCHNVITQNINNNLTKSPVSILSVQEINKLSKIDFENNEIHQSIKENTPIQKEESLKLNSEIVTSNINKNKETEVQIQVPIQEANSLNNIQNQEKSPNKLVITDSNFGEFISEESQPSNLLTDVVASTPLPSKSFIKKEKSVTPKSKSSLFTQEPKSPRSPRHLDAKEYKAIKEEENKRINFDDTVAVNKSLDENTDLVTETKGLHNQSLNLIQEAEYEAFKPKQQSTTLPYPDFDILQEAALSIAKDIDESLENIEENEQFVSATTELFGDPSALDFLNKVGSRTCKRSERYDSLYMKFDPLAQRLSMLPQKNLPTPPTVDGEEGKATKADTPIGDIGTPEKNPALAAIDRLLFYSPPTVHTAPATTTPETEEAEAKQKKKVVEKPEPQLVPVVDEKMAKELELVRSTVLQLEAQLEKQKQEHKEYIEKQKAAFEEKLIHMQTKFNQMQSQLSQEVKCKEQMTVVVEEYEKSISRLIADREKDRTNFETEKAKLQEELQVANQHLSNTEAAFSDVHTKYERLKNVVSAYKSNETVLKESITENQETIKTLENRYEQLKSHAMAQLEKANLELSAIRKQNEAESIKLKALVRKAELKSKSLEETVEQKIKENKELTQIIDEMIARVD